VRVSIEKEREKQRRRGRESSTYYRKERDDLMKILTKQFACQTIKRLIG